MSEKGDLGISNEAISLPPNYAHSETFTDSPPPAYQRKNGPIIRIARMVCLTVLAITFLVGFFVVLHRWVVSKHEVMIYETDAAKVINQNMKPTSQQLKAFDDELVDENQMLQQQLQLGASLIALDIDNNKIEDDIELKGENIDQPMNIEPESSTENQEDEGIVPEQVLPPSPFPSKGLLFPFQGQINKMRIPFPFGGLGMQQEPEDDREIRNPFAEIFNNPGLPDMMKPKGDCKVKKNRKEIAPGVMTESIVMICEKEDVNGGEFMMPPPPPHQMSPMPFLPPHGARRIEPPQSLLNSILKVLAMKHREQKMKDHTEQSQQNPRVVKLISINNDNQHMMPALPFPIRGQRQELPPPMSGEQQPPFPFMNLIPFAKIEVRKQQPENEQNFNNAHDFERNGPFHPRMHFRGPFPFPQEIQQQEQQREEEFNPFGPTSPFGPNVKVIRINRPPNFNNDNDDNQIRPLPFNPFNPVMKLLPARQGRVIRLRRPVENLENDGPPPFSFPNHIMFPHQEEHHEGPFPHPMPEASGRALPDPVALPGMKLFRLPFRPPHNFPLEQLMTHMEMKQQPSIMDDASLPEKFFEPVRSFTLSPFQKIISGPHADSHLAPQQRQERRFPILTPAHQANIGDLSEIENFFGLNNEEENLQKDIEDFGPPRMHTLMHQNSLPTFIGAHNENHEQRQPEDLPNYHTHADGVSHSHPYDGPHTHIDGRIIPLRPNFPQNPDMNFHNHEDGSHSHPFDGPHTHLNGEIIPLRPDFLQHHNNFHTHEDDVSHGHPFDGPLNHFNDEFMPFRPAEPEINFNFHTHDDGTSHFHDHDEPHFDNEEDQIMPINPFEMEQNNNFNNQEDFFISDNTQEFPLAEPEQQENEWRDAFDHQSIFEEQPQIVELQPTVYDDFQPEETIFHHEEPTFQQEEPQFLPEEPQFYPEEPQVYPEEPQVYPEEPQVYPEEPQFLPEEPQFQPEESQLQPEQPQIHAEEPQFQPEEPQFQPEEPQFLPEEPQLQPEEPQFPFEEQPTFQPQEPEAQPEDQPQEIPDFLDLAPLFRPLFPIEDQNTEIVQDTEVAQQQDYDLDQRGYAPEGLFAPIPPPVEEHAEMIEPESVTPVEPEILIK